MKTVYLNALEVPYPPIGYYVADTLEIKDKWEAHLKLVPVSEMRDNNGVRRDIHVLDRTKLQYTVAEDETVLILDAQTHKTICLVVKGMLSDTDLLENFNGAVIDHLNKGRVSMRVDDPGYILGIGYSSGNRKSRELDWAKNLSKGADTDEHRHKMSCVMGFLWSKVREVLPKDVIEDYERICEQIGLFLDGGVFGKSEELLKFKVDVDGGEQVFEIKDKAPPSGVCAMNYCRYTHNEKNANEYCTSFTTGRNHGEDFGGNFSIAKYGIFIGGAANQVVAWRGIDHHGTSLPLLDPLDKDPEFRQTGIAWVLAKGLKGSKATYDDKIERFRRQNVLEVAESKEFGILTIKDREVRPIPRSTMSIRNGGEPCKRKLENIAHPDRHRVAAKLVKAPVDHAYMGWSRPHLVEESRQRYLNGKIDTYRPSWQKHQLIMALIANDEQSNVSEVANDNDMDAAQNKFSGGPAPKRSRTSREDGEEGEDQVMTHTVQTNPDDKNAGGL